MNTEPSKKITELNQELCDECDEELCDECDEELLAILDSIEKWYLDLG